MRIRFDAEADALYLRLDESPIVESEEVHAGVILDFNEADEVVGVEILRVQHRLPDADLTQLDFDVQLPVQLPRDHLRSLTRTYVLV